MHKLTNKHTDRHSDKKAGRVAHRQTDKNTSPTHIIYHPPPALTLHASLIGLMKHPALRFHQYKRHNVHFPDSKHRRATAKGSNEAKRKAIGHQRRLTLEAGSHRVKIGRARRRWRLMVGGEEGRGNLRTPHTCTCQVIQLREGGGGVGGDYFWHGAHLRRGGGGRGRRGRAVGVRLSS